MLHTDLTELTTTLTTSLVKEFRLLQELVDTLREERLAFANNHEMDINRATDLKDVVITEILNNADQRSQHKATLARVLGIEADISCRELARALGDDEAAQILNLIEGSIALWNVAEELNRSNTQFLINTLGADEISEGMDDLDTFQPPHPLRASLEQCNRLDPVIFWLKNKYE